MKALWLAAFWLLATPVFAADTTPMGQFMISPAPCDAQAIASNGWCADIVTAIPPPPPPILTVPPPPLITGPFATLTVNKVQLIGTGVAGDIISIAIDSLKDPNLVTVTPAGNWTFNASATLANGTHVASAVQINGIGTSAPALPLTFAVAVH